MQDLTVSLPLKVLCAADATDATFPARAPTVTEPVAATSPGVIEAASGSGWGQGNLLLMPFGAGADDETFSVRVWGWRKVAGTTVLWVPVLLCEVLCTLGTAVGVAGTAVDASHRFADVLALTTGNANVSVETVSPSGNLPAHFVIDAKGAAKLECTFAKGTTSAGMNALWTGY